MTKKFAKGVIIFETDYSMSFYLLLDTFYSRNTIFIPNPLNPLNPMSRVSRICACLTSLINLVSVSIDNFGTFNSRNMIFILNPLNPLSRNTIFGLSTKSLET